MAMIDLEFDDVELDGLFVPGGGNRAPAPSDDLVDLGRELLGVHLDVVLDWSRESFRRSRPTSEAVHAALDALLRLTEATQDAPLHAALSDIQVLVDAPRAGWLARDRWRVKLRSAVEALAEALGGPAGVRVREVVQADHGSHRLLGALREVRGIGVKRLQRLYCAGLYTPEAVLRAEPEEIAAVSGIPAGLCADVVRATVAFAASERAAATRQLQEAAATLSRSVTWTGEVLPQEWIAAHQAAALVLETLEKAANGGER